MWFLGCSIFHREREQEQWTKQVYTRNSRKKIGKRWYQSNEMATLIHNIGKECTRSRGSSKWSKRFALAILYGQFLDKGCHCRLLSWRSWKKNSFSSSLFLGRGAMMVLANVFLDFSRSSVLCEAHNMFARLRPEFLTAKAVSLLLQFCLERECYPQAKQSTHIICHQSPRLR